MEGGMVTTSCVGDDGEMRGERVIEVPHLQATSGGVVRWFGR